MTSRSIPWHFARRAYAVAFSVFMLMPLFIVLFVSFTDDGYVKFPPSSFGLRWYVAALNNSDFRSGLVFSLEIAIFVAAVAAVLGVSAALVLSRFRTLTSDAVTAVLTMPLAVPHIVIAIALLQFFGLLAIPSSPYGLVCGHLLITMPYVLRLTLTSIKSADRQLDRASASLGASTWYTIRRVTLPMILPGVLAGVIFAFLISFDEVTISLFTALPSRTTLPAQIFAFASQGSDPVVTAVSGLMIFLSSGIVILTERFFGVLRLIANEQT
jgi:putative spermidine/putrescine transport system permease protein